MHLYAARQPILDTDKNLFAYELLFRESIENVFPNIDDDEATSKMVEGLQFNLGLEELIQDKLGFVNFTHETLLAGYPYVLPSKQLVVEVLETVKPGKKLLACCQELKQRGYRIALDDYEHQPVWHHFYPITDIIKIDYQVTPLEEIKQVIAAIADFPHIKLLAEKVETLEQFEQAKALGFCYFQGYFFSKPEVMKSRSLEPGEMALANLMAEMSKDDCDIEKITQALESDVSLSFKLLRYVQSPIFKRQRKIESIKQAVVALGHDELRRFVAVLFSAQLSAAKPNELVIMAMTRAKFCENLAEQQGRKNDKSTAFLTGMLSLINALLDTELPELLDKLPLAISIKEALLDNKGYLADLLKLCPLAERGDWQKLEHATAALNLDSEQALACYSDAMVWSTSSVNASL